MVNEISIKIINLRCEYCENPLAIDVVKPHLSWNISSTRRGQKQTAYRVLVSSSPKLLSEDIGDLWDSRKVESDQSIQVKYNGVSLASRTRCYWKVLIWDRYGNISPWSQQAEWSIGLLRPEDWQAEWIIAKYESAIVTEHEEEKEIPSTKPAVTFVSPWLRKIFTLDNIPQRAFAYVNVMGYYELYINGNKVGKDVLSPAVSDYSKRSFYIAYDVIGYLKEGLNCIGLWLGKGWYHQKYPGVKYSVPIARLQLEMINGDDNSYILTDGTWKSAPSPYSLLGDWSWNGYGGERYDARREVHDWNKPEFNDGGWENVEKVKLQGVNAKVQEFPMNEITEEISAMSCVDMSGGRYELDFGTNLTGWFEIQLSRLESGDIVKFWYADKRYQTDDPNDEITQAGIILNSPGDKSFEGKQGTMRYQIHNQYDEFISAGNQDEKFCSKFNYHGFRYAIIEGLHSHIDLQKVKAKFIETRLEKVGSFLCSNKLFNRINEMNLWTIRCLNLGGYMVDCPHRERFGYGGDGQISIEAAIMNLWMPGFYRKWFYDWQDAQNPDTGQIPGTAPDHHNRRDQGPCWGGAQAALAWKLYWYYGDEKALANGYLSLKKYLVFLESFCDEGILKAYGGEWGFLGDWSEPGRGMDTSLNKNIRGTNKTDEFFVNCYYIYLWELYKKMAKALGKSDEVVSISLRLDKMKKIVHNHYYDNENNRYIGYSQIYQAFPLLLGIVPEEIRDYVFINLKKSIIEINQGHLDTGMTGTYFLIQYLQEVNNKLLFSIVNQKTYPGWGYMLERGATTFWEQWNGFWSQTHACLISIGGWFYQGIAGIQPSAAAFKEIIIKPAIVGDLTFARASYQSMYGTITSYWEVDRDVFALNVKIPVNTSAKIYLPVFESGIVYESGVTAEKSEGVNYLGVDEDCQIFEIESGTYCFEVM